jgi:hypothetical protein
MNDIVGLNRTIPIDDLFENGDGFGLWESFFVFDGLGEVFIAQLSDDEDVGFGIEDIMNLDDILCIFELLKNGDLILQEFFMKLTFNKLEVNGLDGNLFI